MTQPSTRRLPARMATLAALALGTAVLLAAPASQATIYEWTLNGNKYATDRPPPPGAKLIRVRQTESRRPAEESDLSTPPPAAPSAARGSSSDVQQVQQDVAKAQTERCKKAKQRYESYVVAQRLYRPAQPGQQPEYLSDAELAEARVSAKREMDTSCAGQ